MNALVIDRLGGPEVYRIADMPVPEPEKGEVQVRVDGAGMNPVDWKIREGLFTQSTPHKFPAVTLREFSGVITKLGPGVKHYSIGDPVYGITECGAAAEYTVARASSIGPRPKSLHAADAAVVPLAGMTAWQALFDYGKLKSGQRVLIHAAAGGVGTYAVQLAKWAGAYVIGTCSTQHADAVWRLGADQVIDYHRDPFEKVIEPPVDLVLHSIGQDQVAASIQTLRPGGILVSISADPMEAQAAAQGKIAVQFMMQPNTDHLARLSELIDSGKLRPVITAVVPLKEARGVMTELQKGHTLGKYGVRLH
ncbi:MAG TPA: NADP-dependent oxidoreductase [Fimbriimonadaceae bacterium]|nr:NADP-dependent oxidoreductase [Fimbriimonadaceae bacterium]